MLTATPVLKSSIGVATPRKLLVSLISGGSSLTSMQPRVPGIAKEALERIAALYQIEASIRGDPLEQRKAIRQEQAVPLIDDLETWLHAQLTQISGKSSLAGAIRYGLTRLKRLRPYLDDGRLSIDNEAAKCGRRSITIGRKNYLFMGSNDG